MAPEASICAALLRSIRQKTSLQIPHPGHQPLQADQLHQQKPSIHACSTADDIPSRGGVCGLLTNF